ncbi:MAG: ABC transporter ATP-binding protein [Desulfobacterales bacterium]
MALLSLTRVSKTFDRQPFIREVSLSLAAGDILCLLGPSGCGKTTLLRLIAGLERPDSGIITFDGRDLAPVPPHRRQFGMMFQEYALFPHKNVFENVAFGLELQRLTRPELQRRVAETLERVGLIGFAARRIAELSGGERQRVALARSLAPQPRLLLLDEPMGALDRALRERLMADLQLILKQVGVTSIMVTHDQAEAFAVADTVAVIDDGRIAQIAPPETLYRQPASPLVARFLGLHNLVAGRVTADGAVATPLGRFRIPGTTAARGAQVTLLIRPEAASLAPVGFADPGAPVIAVRVAARLFQGQHYLLRTTAENGITLIFTLPNTPPPPGPGQQVHLRLNPSAMSLMPDPRKA